MNTEHICFKKVDYDLNGLLHYIDIGDIGLPDIQRPFVWPNTKVRDLFDSMYRGFPVGYLLFWSNTGQNGTRGIGLDDKQHVVPNLLIVDGQQRLTSLYAVFRGKKVLDNDYRERKIEIAFNPVEGKFEVSDAAIRRDPEWFPNVSDLWAKYNTSYSAIKSYLSNLLSHRAVTEEEEKQIEHSIDRLFDLQRYPFTALEISSTVDEEAVSDIFVRINSQGAKLNQSDFILTLLSVFWDEGRVELENFCRQSYRPPKPGEPPSSFNYFIQPHPGELLRVAVAIGFFRGKLRSVYQVLRGKDPETEEYLSGLRNRQFEILKQAQSQTLSLTSWHRFFTSLVGVGFRGSEMINSNITLLYAYAMYLIGKNRFHVPDWELEKLTGRWYVASTLLSRYIGSFESVMDSDLRRWKDCRSAGEFVESIESIITNTLTQDFWEISLSDALGSSSAMNPQYFTYIASLNKLNAPVLFSNKRISDLLDPALNPNRKPLERHHLYPRAWLERNGVKEINQINQVANFALLEWPDNLSISDAPPKEYVPLLRSRFSPEEWNRMCELHALPEGWENMNYQEFLVQRRKLIAAVIKRAFMEL
ncbi:MAG: DUF262 domain-containing protein [Bacteroidetes bacterium]|nr:DUF262 domain-containing protein [Bacteroidota bacterium]